MIHTIYRATCTISNKIYIGYTTNFEIRKAQHRQSAVTPKSKFHKAIRKHGYENFVWEILYQSYDGDYTKHVMERYFIEQHNSFKRGYNSTLGGDGMAKGCTTMITKDGETKCMFIESDEFKTSVGVNKGKVLAKLHDGSTALVTVDEYKKNNYVGVNRGRTTAKTKTGEYVCVSTDDPRLSTGELVGMQKGKFVAVDKHGNTIFITRDDPRYISGELVAATLGTTIGKDNNGNTFRIRLDDPRYISGEIVSIVSGKVNCENINTGERLTLEITDPRYVSGEYQHINKLYVSAYDSQGNRHRVKKTDPRYVSGELQSKSKTEVIIVNDIPTRVRKVYGSRKKTSSNVLDTD